MLLLLTSFTAFLSGAPIALATGPIVNTNNGSVVGLELPEFNQHGMHPCPRLSFLS